MPKREPRALSATFATSAAKVARLDRVTALFQLLGAVRPSLSSKLLRRRSRLLLLAATGGLSACVSAPLVPEIKSGEAAYTTMGTSTPTGFDKDYRIGAHDTISVNIFQEDQLSVNNAEVDTAGNVMMPLIGPVAASGKTTGQLSTEITQRLSPKYLKNPQISVTVNSSVSQKVIVQGEVQKPGTYPIKGGTTTLLETLALAEGETRTAALTKVVVFRAVNGQRTGAVFDVKAIRSGRAADPPILGNDIVVVGFSNARGVWEDVMKSLPLVNMLRPF